MISKNVTVVLVCMGLSAFFSCRKEDNGWTGMVINEGEVRVVKNPATPLYGELELEIEMDLAIGNEDDDQFSFFRANDLEIDSDGNIFVLDAGNGRIQKFAPDGDYLQTFGKKGQGPGELNSPFAFAFDTQGNLYVGDGQKIHVFDSLGKFQRSITLVERIMNFYVDGDGYFVATGIKTTEEGTRQIVALFDPEGSLVRNLREFSDIQRVTKSGQGAVMSFKAYHQYSNTLGHSAASDGGMIYGYPSEYKVYKADGKGNPVEYFTKDDPPEEISRQEKDSIIEGIGNAFSQRGYDLPKDVLEETCQFPPHKPFFRGITVDDEGRIYVALSDSVLQRDAPVEIDIFSPSGIYLYKTSLPFSPDLVRNNRVYDIFTSDETGEISIRRYRIGNWGRIRIEAEI